MEKKSISKIVNMLRSSSINKVTMVNILMQENTYDEMHTIYAKVPGIFKSIFTLPYLKRNLIAKYMALAIYYKKII